MVPVMFENKRTGAKAGELRAYASEEESDARSRLEAAGWNISEVDYEFENKVFKPKMKADDANESDES
jgi:hypothetical protein